jgi:hypothetical protein
MKLQECILVWIQGHLTHELDPQDPYLVEVLDVCEDPTKIRDEVLR